MGRTKKSNPSLMRRHYCISVLTDRKGTEITEKTTHEVDADIREYVETLRPANFAQWVLEVCPESERLHFHLYVEFETSVRWRTLQKELPDAVGSGQVELRGGTREQARLYCSPEFFDSEKGWKKDFTHLAGPWTHGVWREDADDISGQSREATAYGIISDGGHPRDVALLDGQTYGRQFRGLYALYNELRGIAAVESAQPAKGFNNNLNRGKRDSFFRN